MLLFGYFGHFLEPKSDQKVIKNGEKNRAKKSKKNMALPGPKIQQRRKNSGRGGDPGAFEFIEKLPAKFSTRPAPLPGAADLKG